VGFALMTKVGAIRVNIFDKEDFVKEEQWLDMIVTETSVSVISYPYDSKVQIKARSLRVIDTSLLKREIIQSEIGKNVFEVDISIFNIYSPNLKEAGAELIVKVGLCKLTVLFHPQTVNSIIKFFRNVKYEENVADLEGMH
jgi:hypothetical protein